MASSAVVSVSMGVMKPVLDKLAALMGDEYKKLKGLRKEVTFLQRELGDMDALLEKMDLADQLDPQAKYWRKDIIEMSYDIEDRIDDFMHRVGEPNDKIGILQKASQFLRTFKDRHRLANQFQEIKTRVMEASKRRNRYMLDQCISVTLDQCISVTAPVVIDPRLSVLYKESAILVGIETQKDELVKWAMDERQGLKMMAIVGSGGLGKTTLANEVCREVEGQFNLKAFVSVSQKPEIIGLFNSLLSQFGLATYSHACQVQDPINKLRRHLQDKRYFIVVDDLWDTRAWNSISCAFPQDSQRSRVMITTRIECVARECCANHGFIHIMKPLSEADSRKLFFDRIFGSEDACPSELMNASSEILKKCGGLPLAVITMASMLACQPARLKGQWEYIQNSLATNKFATNSKYEDMMYILDLSYKNLPRHLKACFLYLGSYPEDYEISRVELVRRWVAEGFVSNSDGQDVWDAAETYFNELVNRSMVQPTYDYILGIYGCKVHDMLLELIARRCKEDNFLSLVHNSAQAAVEAQDKVIRRLTIFGLLTYRGYSKNDYVTPIKNQSQIRSLTLLGAPYWCPPLLKFKFVRVLFLGLRGNAMNLTHINKLSHLRYFKVESYNIFTLSLPRPIEGLRLLETLDLFGLPSCNGPIEIVDAPRLSHLMMPYGLRMPSCIGKFKSLRTLRGFCLPTDSLEGIIGLGELTGLQDLQLYPHRFPSCLLERKQKPQRWCAPLVEATWMAALGASLQKLCNLKQLAMTSYNKGGVQPCLEHVAFCADALSLLSPRFHDLVELDLRAWTFSRFPRWIGHLQGIRNLQIGVKQILQEDVAMIGTRLPALLRLSLRIPGIPIGKIVIGGSIGFPAVRWFKFECDRMSFLIFESEAMPELKELELMFLARKWDKAAPGGLQHLPSLEKVVLPIGKCSEGAGVFREAANAPRSTRPAFTLEMFDYQSYQPPRLKEEEDYLKQHQMEEEVDWWPQDWWRTT